VPRAGIRVPDSAFIRSVARAHGQALALTSANVSGGLSTLAVCEFSELWEKVRLACASCVALLKRPRSVGVSLTAGGCQMIGVAPR